MKTIIELSEDLAGELDAFCKQESIPRVVCIRHALSSYLATKKQNLMPGFRHYFSSWERPGDSLLIEAAYRERW